MYLNWVIYGVSVGKYASTMVRKWVGHPTNNRNGGVIFSALRDVLTINLATPPVPEIFKPTDASLFQKKSSTKHEQENPHL